MFYHLTDIILLQRCFASLVLFVMLTTFIISGVLLPYQQAQAILSILGMQIPPYIIEILKYVSDGVNWAYTKAQGAITAMSTWWSKVDTMYKDALKWVWNVLRKKLLNMLVDDIIKWIQGGGTPRIVSDWQGFLKSAGDQAAGQFIEKYLGMGFLCKQFDVSLRIMLAAPPTFDRAATCSLSQITKNIQDFYDNIQNGGWKSWLSVSETQNNMYGMYLTSQDYKWGLESAANEAAKNEGISSSGFLGDKVCRNICQTNGPDCLSTTLQSDKIPEGYTCTQWENRTPGKIVADSMTKAANLDIDWLISSKEFSEYATAIMDAVINRVIKEGVTRMTTSGGSATATANGQIVPGVNAPPNIQVDLSSYADATASGANAFVLIDQQKLLIENLQKLVADYQTSLGTLNSIKDSQNNTLSLARDYLQNNCALPANTTQTTLSPQTTGSCSNNACPCTATFSEKRKISIPGTGEITIEKTTTQNYQDLSGSCSLFSTTVNSQTISTSPAVEKDIADLNAKILTGQNKISQFKTANTDTLAYNQAAADYTKAYEDGQRGNMAVATSTAETAMKTTKQKAVASNQAALSTTSTDFNQFTQQTSQGSADIGQEYVNSQTKRGFSSDCAYVQDNTLYKDLCNAKSTQSSWQSSYSSCSASL